MIPQAGTVFRLIRSKPRASGDDPNIGTGDNRTNT